MLCIVSVEHNMWNRESEDKISMYVILKPYQKVKVQIGAMSLCTPGLHRAEMTLRTSNLHTARSFIHLWYWHESTKSMAFHRKNLHENKLYHLTFDAYCIVCIQGLREHLPCMEKGEASA